MTTMLEYTKEEIATHKLKIPTDAEIDALIDKLITFEPMLQTSSQTQINPNGFCVCSRTGTNVGGCNTC